MRKIMILVASLLALSVQAKTVVIPKPYVNPPVKQSDINKSKSPLTRPGLCELEVANLSHKSAFVDLVYDNFSVSAGHHVAPGYSLYVPLHYGGYCHSAVYALLYSPESTILYKDFGYVDQILKIYSGLNSVVSVKAVKKDK